MKRLVVSLLIEQVTALVLASAFVGCNGKIDEPSTPAPAEPLPLPATNDAGATPVPTGEPPGTFQGLRTTPPVSAPACATTAAASAVADLPLPAGVDAVLEYAPWALDPTVAPTLAVVVGTPCATAKDPAACKATIASLTAGKPQPTGEGCAGSAGACDVAAFLITTRADSVTKVTAVADVLALYGPVNTPAETALFAQVKSADTVVCKDITPVSDGFQYGGCGGPFTVHPDGTVQAGGSVCLGRLTDGCVVAAPTEGMGGWLANMAELERAAVDAFARMSIELRHHGAPDALISRADEARRDEIRHAAVMAEQAARFGGRVRPAAVVAMTVRDRETIALENALEGCVRETFGAVVAAYQAATAADPELRACLATIAADEARHAQLSWDVAAWLEPQLAPAARARIDAARAIALERLAEAAEHDAVEQAAVPGLAVAAGLPSPTTARALMRATRPRLEAVTHA